VHAQGGKKKGGARQKAEALGPREREEARAQAVREAARRRVEKRTLQEFGLG